MNSFFYNRLIEKYNTSGPRYTSYPTALEFSEKLPDNPLRHATLTSAGDGLSLYIHIPFCKMLCYYCGCNKIVTRQQEKADRYLDYLEKEIALNRNWFAKQAVKQCHLGGGTPSFLTKEQMSRLMSILRNSYQFSNDCEISIEVDPRGLTTGYLTHLKNLGFNRLSIGVQDIDPKVQSAINREQSTPHIGNLVFHAKKIGFQSINLDLIYGLPHQTVDTFSKTLKLVSELNPERISLFSYAHLPLRFASQRKIKDNWLPFPEQKLVLMRCAIEYLTNYGYSLIGMDHFAKSNDELAIAQKSGTLHRNFQGYTTKQNLDLLGLGVSSISFIGDWYLQNEKTLNDYYTSLDNESLAICKGVGLTADDEVRRAVIMSLMCNLHIDIKAIETNFEIDFEQYFADEITQLGHFIDDGLVDVTEAKISIVPEARLLMRNIAMTFDKYLGNTKNHQRFSRVI